MIGRLSDYMARVKGELKLISKYASMVTTQAEQVLKAQSDLLDELNNKHDFAVRVATRTSKMTQEPLYPEGHLMWSILRSSPWIYHRLTKHQEDP